MELEESIFLTSDNAMKLSSTRHYDTCTKIEIQTNGKRHRAQKLTHAPMGTLLLTKEAIIYNGANLVQFSSVAQSCPTLCNPMNCSTPGLPVHQKLPDFTETHAHRFGDAIQPSYPLSSPSPPASNPSQHQGLFQ